MREYRMYRMNEVGEIKEAPIILAASDDDEAQRLAQRISGPGRHELWFRATMIKDWHNE